mmetsp:Transcript_154021/g.283805  ORF Transcript_154021/g.283805 Transcript_154021/m.283805 type:complete len:888 (+) Transcript_154021:64-2727(+)
MALAKSCALDPILGSWVDANGSKYHLTLDEPDRESCTVYTLRKDGKSVKTQGLVRALRDHKIIWGKNYLLDARSVTETSVRWTSTQGRRYFVWTRDDQPDPPRSVSSDRAERQPARCSQDLSDEMPPLIQSERSILGALMSPDSTCKSILQFCIFHGDRYGFDRFYSIRGSYRQRLEMLLKTLSLCSKVKDRKGFEECAASFFVGADALHITSAISLGHEEILGRGFGLNSPGLEWELDQKVRDRTEALAQIRSAILEKLENRLRRAPKDSIAFVFNSKDTDVEYRDLKEFGCNKSPESTRAYLLMAGAYGFDGNGDVDPTFSEAIINVCALQLGRNRVIRVACNGLATPKTLGDASVITLPVGGTVPTQDAASVRVVEFLSMEFRQGVFGNAVAGAEKFASLSKVVTGCERSVLQLCQVISRRNEVAVPGASPAESSQGTKRTEKRVSFASTPVEVCLPPPQRQYSISDEIKERKLTSKAEPAKPEVKRFRDDDLRSASSHHRPVSRLKAAHKTSTGREKEEDDEKWDLFFREPESHEAGARISKKSNVYIQEAEQSKVYAPRNNYYAAERKVQPQERAGGIQPEWRSQLDHQAGNSRKNGTRHADESTNLEHQQQEVAIEEDGCLLASSSAADKDDEQLDFGFQQQGARKAGSRAANRKKKKTALQADETEFVSFPNPAVDAPENDDSLTGHILAEHATEQADHQKTTLTASAATNVWAHQTGRKSWADALEEEEGGDEEEEEEAAQQDSHGAQQNNCILKQHDNKLEQDDGGLTDGGLTDSGMTDGGLTDSGLTDGGLNDVSGVSGASSRKGKRPRPKTQKKHKSKSRQGLKNVLLNFQKLLGRRKSRELYVSASALALAVTVALIAGICLSNIFPAQLGRFPR